MVKVDNNTLSLKDFVYLMLVTLADNSRFVDVHNSDKKFACLPGNYKQIIENILCANYRWKEEFSVLIDVDEYFDDHFGWELNLAITLRQVLMDLDIKWEYDFVKDMIVITFSKDEISEIMKNYDDENINLAMCRFTNLLVDYIYTREFQEEFYDYSATSVSKMKSIRESKLNTSWDDNVSNGIKFNKRTKKRIFRK